MLSLITSSKYWEVQDSILAAWNKVCSALFHPFVQTFVQTRRRAPIQHTLD